jgi:hypothetical protein
MNKKARIAEMHRYFESLIEKYGWASHYVPLDQYHINYHTHGVQENYNHYDLQIVLPLEMGTANGLAGRIIEDIKQGKVFEPGMVYYGYLKEGYPITFKIYSECGRSVLRIILCDQNKLIPTDEGCDIYYKKQIDVLDD